ncbi:FtsX-like permease family protein [Dactylosporangium sp. CS-033363]|uniref:FtsX-like permease family protein n=1 Tax=Dactylosporangium sp. CS-033363 TaxID=3239935 RepID=UPI003D930B4D
MNWLVLGVRLAFSGGREAAARLAVMTAGVAVGVALLLLALTALPALQGRDHRAAWQRTTPSTAATAPDGALWLPVYDHYRGRPVLRVHVAALGPRPPVPPGLDRLPGPGEVAVSPALRTMLDGTAPDELGDRMPGRVAASIGAAGLSSPDELVAVVGADPGVLRAAGAVEIHGIAAGSPGILVNGYLRVMLLVAALALLVPVVVFVAMTTRVAAARREQRFAALRLTGATSGQVGWMAATESGMAAVGGVLAGWAGYAALRPAVAALVTFDGLHFVAADVAAPPPQLAAVLVGVPLLVVASTLTALHRVRLGPLGVARAVRRRRPGAWRVAVPMLGLLGFALLAVLRAGGLVAANGTPALLLTAGSLVLTLLGLVVAGAWATMLAARVLARAGGRAAPLLAARRMAADPSTTFRAIAGVVLAAFVTSLFAGVSADPGAKTLEGAQLRPGIVEVLAEGQSPARVAELTSALATVGHVVVVRGAAPGTVAVSCAELSTVVNVRCDAPSFAGLPPPGLRGITALAPPATDGPVHALYVEAGPSEDRVRTMVAVALPGAVTSTRTDQVELDTRQLRELDQGLRLALLFVIVVAGCSLAVAAVAGLTERRRPFALLRATGVRLAELRVTVLLETAVPLAATLAVGCAAGTGAGAAIASASGQHWSPPGRDYLLTMLLELAVAVVLTALPLTLADRLTRYEAVRYD